MPMTNHNPPHDWQRWGEQHNIPLPSFHTRTRGHIAIHNLATHNGWTTSWMTFNHPQPPLYMPTPPETPLDMPTTTTGRRHVISWMDDGNDLACQWTCHVVHTVMMHVIITVHILYVSDSLSPIPFFTQEAGDLATNNAWTITTKDNNDRQCQGKQHVSPPPPPPLLFSHRQWWMLNCSTTPTMLQCHVTLHPTLLTTKLTTTAHKWWPAPTNRTRQWQAEVGEPTSCPWSL